MTHRGAFSEAKISLSSSSRQVMFLKALEDLRLVDREDEREADAEDENEGAEAAEADADAEPSDAEWEESEPEETGDVVECEAFSEGASWVRADRSDELKGETTEKSFSIRAVGTGISRGSGSSGSVPRGRTVSEARNTMSQGRPFRKLWQSRGRRRGSPVLLTGSQRKEPKGSASVF